MIRAVSLAGAHALLFRGVHDHRSALRETPLPWRLGGETVSAAQLRLYEWGANVPERREH
jgi:hypothetical protein